MNEPERAEYNKTITRHAEISKAIIQKDEKRIYVLCGSMAKAEAELEELERFLNYG